MKTEVLRRMNFKWPPDRKVVPTKRINPYKRKEIQVRSDISLIHEFPNLKKPIQIKYEIPKPEKQDFEIFAYCSKNYQDAYEFVIDSWTNIPNMKKITLYTDWNFEPKNEKVIVKHMFEINDSWIIGTGRRLDVIKHFSETNKGIQKNVLFLDIDCFLVKDPSEIFTLDFDIAISRLNNQSDYTKSTATAGLWFCKLTPGYYKFINDWFKVAQVFKEKGFGIKNHRISYVQYSFTYVAKKQTLDYKVLPINVEAIINHGNKNIDDDSSKNLKLVFFS